MSTDSFIPNSFQTPNAYVDRLMALLTSDEYKVLSYAARRIFGFQKRTDRISLSQFTDGVVNGKTGERLDAGTGLALATARRAVHTLLEYRVLIEVAPNDPHVNAGPLYTLQLDASQVDYAGLEARRAEQQGRNTARTQAATARRTSGPPNVGHTPLRHTLGGMLPDPLTSDVSTPLTSDVTTPLTSDVADPLTSDVTHNNQRKPVENQGEKAPPTADPFDEITSARVQRQQRLADQAAATRKAPPPRSCPAYAELPPAFRAELVDLLQAYADDAEAVVRRQVAWYRQEQRRELRTVGEWQTAIRAVVQEEIDKRLPTPPRRAAATAVRTFRSATDYLQEH